MFCILGSVTRLESANVLGVSAAHNPNTLAHAARLRALEPHRLRMLCAQVLHSCTRGHIVTARKSTAVGHAFVVLASDVLRRDRKLAIADEIELKGRRRWQKARCFAVAARTRAFLSHELVISLALAAALPLVA